MNDNSMISPEDIRELKAEYAAAMLSDETLADIARQFEEEIPNDIFIRNVDIVEGQVSRVRIEQNGIEVANISFELDPEPAKYQRKQRILIVGAHRGDASLLRFEQQAEMLGIEIDYISVEAYERTQLPRHAPYLETLHSLQSEVAEISKHLKSQEMLANVVDQATSAFHNKRHADDIKAHLGYKQHGSRRGRNIKDDKSRKASYSKSRK